MSPIGPKVLAAFGGARALHRALIPYDPTLSIMTVYRWGYPRGRNRGTDGFIPSRRLALILAVAQRKGINLDITLEDLACPPS